MRNKESDSTLFFMMMSFNDNLSNRPLKNA